MAQLTIRTGERFEVRGSPGDPFRREIRIPIVEVWVGGVRFIHDCMTDEDARTLALRVSIDSGIP